MRRVGCDQVNRPGEVLGEDMGLCTDDLQLVEGDLPEVDGHRLWLVTDDHHAATVGDELKGAEQGVGTTRAFEYDARLVIVQ